MSTRIGIALNNFVRLERTSKLKYAGLTPFIFFRARTFSPSNIPFNGLCYVSVGGLVFRFVDKECCDHSVKLDTVG